MFRVGVDVGGTFTDVVAYEESKGEIIYNKTPTTPKNPIEGIIRGIEELEIGFDKIKLLIISTTVVTNAIVTGSLPRGALITTKGFKDVIEIRRGTREDIWDHYRDPMPPPIKRRDRFEVDERINYRGEVLKPLNIEELKKVVSIIMKRGIRHIAIVFINSYINPIHEILAKGEIEKIYPEAYISASYEINPEIFEFERTSTTVLNALTMGIVRDFVASITKELENRGFRGGILLFHSGGGSLTPESSVKYAVRLAGAGPTAGVIGANYVAQALGYKNVLTFDAGGTTTLASIIYNGEIRFRKDYMISYGYPIRFPTADVITIGAGGGSVAWIDQAGSLRVGPISMGADPGPACYNKGGVEPTLTDANVVTGRLSRETFLGGKMSIYPELSMKVISEKIARPLGLDLYEAAEGIINIAVSNMANAIRLISIARGYDPRDFILMAFGGSGPLHAALVAKDLGIPKILIPRWPGMISALGALVTDVRLDKMKTLITVLDKADIDKLEEEYRELEKEVLEMLLKEGFKEDEVQIYRYADARYFGQWRSLTISIPRPILDIGEVIERFHSEHEREYSYSDKSQKVELYGIRVVGVGLIKKPELPRISIRGKNISEAKKGVRKVYYDGNFMEFDIYARERIAPGSEIEGPALVEQMDSVTLIPPDWLARIDEYGNIVLEVR